MMKIFGLSFRFIVLQIALVVFITPGIISAAPTAPIVYNHTGFIVKQLTMSGGTLCALKNDGTVWCWGRYASGDGTYTQKNIPTQVLKGAAPGDITYLGDGPTKVSQISFEGDGDPCALKTDGTVWCWGYNTNGDLGDGTKTDHFTPVQVHGVGNVGMLTGVLQITSGCAIKTDGLYCWGYNTWGQVGDGTSGLGSDKLTPVRVLKGAATGDTTYFGDGLHKVVQVSRAVTNTCAIKDDGTAWCWGTASGGLIGNNTSSGNQATPAQVNGANNVGKLAGVSQIYIGDYNGCAVTNGPGAVTPGAAYCWGNNTDGALGDNSTTARLYPVQVHGVGNVGMLTNVSQITSRTYETCAIKTDGTVYCWGYGVNGTIGNDTWGVGVVHNLTPIQVFKGSPADGDTTYFGDGPVKVSQILLSTGEISCATKTDGIAYCWGYSGYSQLANGIAQAFALTPVQILGSSGSCSIPTGVSQDFFIFGTEPTSPYTVRYGVDWSEPADGVVDEWAPASGLTRANNLKMVSHLWSTSGSHSFKVLTENSTATRSAWTSYSCTTTAAPPTASIVIPTADVSVSQGTPVSFSGAGTVNGAAPTSGAIVGTYTAGTNPSGVALDPSTNSVWVTNYMSNNVTKLNATTGALVGTYAVGSLPYTPVFDSSTNSIWVANAGASNIVTKLNATTGTTIGSYTAGSNPMGIAFDPSTNSVWVVNNTANNVKKFNASTGALIGTYTVGAVPYYIAFDSSTNSVWVTNYTSNTVTKLNASNGSLIGTYTVGANPAGITFDYFTNSIWVVNDGANSITKLRASDGATLGTYSVGSWPWGAVFDSSTNSVWVTNNGSNSVTNLNASNGVIAGTYPVGTFPMGIAFDPLTNSVWTANSGSNNVTKLSTGTNTITAYEWREGNCTTGTLLSTASSFNLATPAVATRTIYLRVQDSLGTWSTNCPSRVVTVTPGNTAPNAPTISGPTTAIVNNAGTYSFLSTDPDSNQIRYGIDWNMDGTADEWLPAGVSYVNSGTAQSTTHSWSTTGTKTFQALAQDTPGTNSAWTPYTVTVSNPLSCDIAHVTSWGTCNPSAACTQPPAQLTGQPGTHVGTCPSPAYTGTVVDTCSTATITCTVPATVCGNNICETGETFGNCPHDCRGRVQQF